MAGKGILEGETSHAEDGVEAPGVLDRDRARSQAGVAEREREVCL